MPFQFAGGPLLDEADNADMTPQCMPVIDPNFVRENFIEGCVLGKLTFDIAIVLTFREASIRLFITSHFYFNVFLIRLLNNFGEF